MGIGGIGIWQLLITLVIVLLLFGTKKLRNLGGDLGKQAVLGMRERGGKIKAKPIHNINRMNALCARIVGRWLVYAELTKCEA